MIGPHPPELLFHFWNKGKNLHQAPHFFASSTLLNAYNDAPAEVSLLKTLSKETKSLEDIPGEGVFDRMQRAYNLALPQISKNDERRDIFSKMQIDLVRNLRNGQFIGVGYCEPRKPTDFPALIPRDIWDDQFNVDWKQSKVAGNGLSFLSVKILPSDNLPQQYDAEPINHKPPKKVGRPSVKQKIWDAYEILRDEDSIDFNKPQTHMYPQIREWLTKRFPKDIDRLGNLSDETIRLTLSDQFKANKKTKKQ
jgi:hypothetical protein